MIIIRNTQPIDYIKLPTILKRYKLEDKLRYAEKYSRLLMHPKIRYDLSELSNQVLPWELECFVSLSLKAKEWKYDNLDESRFLQIMNAIRDTSHPELTQKQEDSKYAHWLIMMLSATQFDYLDSCWHKLYRFAYYFNYTSEKINMPKEFQQKFGIDYQCVLTFALALWTIYIIKCEDISLYKNKLVDAYPKEVSLLTIDREGFIAELDKITLNPVDYIYCLRPSYSFPFIKNKEETYIPLPHLIIRASTSSLMFRLTSDNDRLRETIGSEVLESYLLHILSSYHEFDQVKKEIVYTKGKLQNQRSADVMTCIRDQIICFDSKSYTPKSSLRIFSEEAYQVELKRLGKAVKQMYEQTHNKFGIEYDPFNISIKPDKSNIWGLVIVSENPFFHLGDVYIEASNQLGVDLSEEEYEWLQGHIGIVELSALEYQLFSSDNILSVIQRNAKTKSFNDHWFSSIKAKNKSSELKAFQEKQSNLAQEKLISLFCISE